MSTKNRDCPNLGWLYYKEYYEGLDKVLKNNPSKDSIALFFKEKREEFLTKSRVKFEEWNYADTLTGASSFPLVTTYPGLIIGISNIHRSLGEKSEIKLGLQFDYTTGLPYIPGSSVKGTIRSMFPYSLGETPKNKFVDKEEYRKERFGYIRELFKGQDYGNGNECLTDREIQALEFDIFTNSDGEKAFESGKRDLFLDAFPDVSQKETKLLDVDYVTPHYPDLLKEPVPIQFLKIGPNITFKFQFILHDTYLSDGKAYKEKENLSSYKKISAELKETVFKQILLDIGIGAKTNVGYGQLCKNEKPK